MALLFTVVLSACPSRISQSHNPLFIPTEAQSVCKWTWVMADKERLTSPPIQTSHAASNTHLNTHARTLAQTIEEEREQMRKVFVFFFSLSGYYPLLSLLSLRFYVMSPCKKSLYGLSRPHGYECGEVDCGRFRTPPGTALSARYKRASPDSFRLQTGKPSFI